MSTGSNIEINLEGDILELIKQLSVQFDTLNGKVDNLEQTANQSFKGIGDSLKQINFVAITQGLENFRNTLNSVNQPGLDFEYQMAELSAITGVVGDDLEVIGDIARKNAKVFGGDASKSVEGFKLILSQLTPELAKQPEVLGVMGESVAILSKQMGNDVPAAVEVLTTAMNQYGVDLSDPIKAQAELNRMMNAMAQGAADGSAELPQLKEAIQKSGAIAKDSGVGFSQMIASLEELDKAGFKASEGGTAYNAVLREINQGRFMPTAIKEGLQGMGVDVDLLADRTVSFTDKMRMLQPVMENDRALFDKLFGNFNAAAAAMVRTADSQDVMALAAENSNIANEQANIMMDTKIEKLSRLSAWFTDQKIKISEATGSLLPYTESMFGVMQAISTVVPAISGMTKAIKWLRVAENQEMITKQLSATWTGVVTTAQWAWNAALTANPIGLVIVGIAALIAVIVIIVKKYEEWGAAATLALGIFMPWLAFAINLVQSFRRHWDEVVSAFKDGGILEGIKKIGAVILDAILMPVQQLLELIAKIPGLGGIAGAGADKIAELRGNLGLNDKSLKEHGSNKNHQKDADAKSRSSKHEERPEDNGYLPFVPAGDNTKTTTSQASASSGGSSGSKNITVSIENLVKELTIKTDNLSEGIAQAKKMVTEGLVGAVRDFEATM